MEEGTEEVKKEEKSEEKKEEKEEAGEEEKKEEEESVDDARSRMTRRDTMSLEPMARKDPLAALRMRKKATVEQKIGESASGSSPLASGGSSEKPAGRHT